MYHWGVTRESQKSSEKKPGDTKTRGMERHFRYTGNNAGKIGSTTTKKKTLFAPSRPNKRREEIGEIEAKLAQRPTG